MYLENVDLTNSIDREFKLGLYVQNQKFLRDDLSDLCSNKEQVRKWPIYESIAGYDLDTLPCP